MIKHHHVLVNSTCITDPKYKVQKSDRIEVDGNRIDTNPFHYYMLNKPKGYICAHHDKKYPCIIDLFSHDCFCIGRLDIDTTGLLLVTNDKSLSKQLLMPQFHVDKTYHVTVLEKLDKHLISLFKQGIIIDKNIICRSAQLEIIDDYHCFVTLYEGRYHQVKKMFMSVNNQVLRLKRVSFAGMQLDNKLKEGEYRSLSDEEFYKLKEHFICIK